MNKQTEALKMAIEALVKCKEAYLAGPNWQKVGYDILDKSHKACKEALEQPTQEAVERDYQEEDGCPTELVVLQRFWRKHQQPAQEPYGWVYEERIDDPEHPDGYYWSWGFSWIEIGSGKPVYTHPAPSWQGLTSEEIRSLDLDNDVISVIFQTEKLLKEKNT